MVYGYNLEITYKNIVDIAYETFGASSYYKLTFTLADTPLLTTVSIGFNVNDEKYELFKPIIKQYYLYVDLIKTHTREEAMKIVDTTHT